MLQFQTAYASNLSVQPFRFKAAYILKKPHLNQRWVEHVYSACSTVVPALIITQYVAVSSSCCAAGYMHTPSA